MNWTSRGLMGDVMQLRLDTNYTKEELIFLDKYNCEILSEIKLSRTNFSENDIPKRIFKFGGVYIAEVIDDESNQFIWGVLSKWKGVWYIREYYDSLKSLEEGL